MSSFRAYYVARRIASDMDRRGEVPGPFWQWVFGTAMLLIVAGAAGIVIVGGGDFLLWSLGIIH